MYCWRCGKRNGAGETACAACGAELSKPKPEEPALRNPDLAVRRWRLAAILLLIALAGTAALLVSIALRPFTWLELIKLL